MHHVATTDRLGPAAPMVVVHTMFRRELRLAGDLVRRVAGGDVRRAGLVAAHLSFLLRGLEHHHTLEDELLWPRLHERVEQQLAPVVARMEDQHADIHARMLDLAGAVPAWAQAASGGERDHLAQLLDGLHVVVADHLDAEEEHVLPLALRHLDAHEWEEISRRAEAGTDRRDRTLAFGMFQYEGDPEAVTSMLGAAPRPVRVLVPVLARRAFRRHAQAVHGTATP